VNADWLDTPVGALTVREEGGAIVALDWGRHRAGDGSPVLARALGQLAGYFEGRLRDFDLPLAPRGNPFRQSVLAALRAIPYGETRRYGDLARDLGVSAQAIGQACGANPIPVIIPCHRVLAADGLGGYSGRGGIEAKVALLKLEGAASLLL
jgi:methylated-DNA-[protein]-cysteine S-methyltransferase